MVDDGRCPLDVRYLNELNSSYNSEVILTQVCSDIKTCKEFAEFQDPFVKEIPLASFNPLSYGFSVLSIGKEDKQFVYTEYCSEIPSVKFPNDNGVDFIIHHPSEVHGYDNGRLLLAIVTRAHGKGQLIAWYRGDVLVADGVNLCVFAPDTDGIYTALVQWNDTLVFSKPVKVQVIA